MDFKLERVQLALDSLGKPQQQYDCVHIGGTNGKGSAAAMISSVLGAAGYRVGLYTSPHLVRFTERIRVGPAEIAPGEGAELVEEIRARVTSRGIAMTFFEFTTVIALLYFARQAIDIAMVEVGLGGRLDATNVIDPAVSVITTIGLDHEEYLGGTREGIAREKGGIIKTQRPVVLGRIGRAEKEVLRSIAAARRSAIYELGADFGFAADSDSDYAGLGRRIVDLKVALRGAHQRDNAATAVAAVQLLPRDYVVADDAVRAGIAGVSWPGRLQVIEDGCLIVLDGAHNQDGAAALARELASLVGGRRLHLLFGVMRDKRWLPMAQLLGKWADDVTVTTVLPPRGESAERLEAVFGKIKPTRAVADPVRAFLGLRASAGAADAILVAGSLYLVGAVYPHACRLASSLAVTAPSTP